jgi:hypothetical protein
MRHVVHGLCKQRNWSGAAASTGVAGQGLVVMVIVQRITRTKFGRMLLLDSRTPVQLGASLQLGDSRCYLVWFGAIGEKGRGMFC